MLTAYFLQFRKCSCQMLVFERTLDPAFRAEIPPTVYNIYICVYSLGPGVRQLEIVRRYSQGIVCRVQSLRLKLLFIWNSVCLQPRICWSTACDWGYRCIHRVIELWGSSRPFAPAIVLALAAWNCHGHTKCHDRHHAKLVLVFCAFALESSPIRPLNPELWPLTETNLDHKP